MRFFLDQSDPRLEQPHTPAPRLVVTRRLVVAIRSHARNAAPNECVGLLASRPDNRSSVVTHAVLLEAITAPARAVADPRGIARVVARLRARGLIPRGFWHSHGNFPVHHSSEDDATMTRLLPGMAEHNFERPVPPHLAPAVTAPDEAWLPLPDGTALAFTLVGPPIPELDAHIKSQWESITIRYRGQGVAPWVAQRGGRLLLHGGGVVLVLGLPPAAMLSSRLVEASPVRVATMYSLVTNIRGELYAEALTVHDVNGRSLTELAPCTIDIVQRPDAAGRPLVNGPIEAIGLTRR